jgi:hypothetical protein
VLELAIVATVIAGAIIFRENVSITQYMATSITYRLSGRVNIDILGKDTYKYVVLTFSSDFFPKGRAV